MIDYVNLAYALPILVVFLLWGIYLSYREDEKNGRS